MNAFKQRCIELREKDHTLAEIIRLTGRKKTTVYHHIRNIPLSGERVNAIRKASGVHIRKFATLRKGKSDRGFTPFDTWNAEKVLLLAHFMFDGEIRREGCMYNNRNKALLDRVERCMKSVYSFPPTRYHNKLTGVSRISYFNVTLGPYIKAKAIELLKEVTKMPLELKREFVRAFFDDEGCMDFRGKNRRVRGYQKNVSILKIVQGLLANFDIESHIELPNEIVISGKGNLIKFQSEFNFSPGVCINGERSNSIWKKSLEKREILQMAINSFQS